MRKLAFEEYTFYMMTNADGLGICAVANVAGMGDWSALFSEFLNQLTHVRLAVPPCSIQVKVPRRIPQIFLKNPQLGKLA